MANRGNTGQRYKLATLVHVEVEGNKVLHQLSCGHEYRSGMSNAREEDAVRYAEVSKGFIGRKQRCNQCG